MAKIIWIMSWILFRIETINQRVSGGYLKVRRATTDMGAILGVFITGLIAVVLSDPFRDQVVANFINFTGGGKAIADQLPLFWVLLVVAIIVGPVAREFSRI